MVKEFGGVRRGKKDENKSEREEQEIGTTKNNSLVCVPISHAYIVRETRL